jgi:hypothetical protein
MRCVRGGMIWMTAGKRGRCVGSADQLWDGLLTSGARLEGRIRSSETGDAEQVILYIHAIYDALGCRAVSIVMESSDPACLNLESIQS